MGRKERDGGRERNNGVRDQEVGRRMDGIRVLHKSVKRFIYKV